MQLLVTLDSLILILAMTSVFSAVDNRDRFEPRTFTDGDYKLPYRLLKPRDYDARQNYPLVIFLHGAGERGDDNEQQLVHGMNGFADDEIMAKYPAFVIAPQSQPTKPGAASAAWPKRPRPKAG